MSSNGSEQMGYVKDRAANALAQLRRGEFGLILHNFKVELLHRIDAITGKTRHSAIIAGRTVKISALQAQQKAREAQHKFREVRAQHTHGEPPPALEQHFDQILVEEVVPDSAFRNSRKLVPASVRPTGARLYKVEHLEADAEALFDQLVAVGDDVKPASVA